MVAFSELTYLPTLLMRWSELKALENLSGDQKDHLFPLIRMRPWGNSNEFSNSFRKLKEVIGDRAFACDLDDWYSSDKSSSGSAEEFRQIKKSSNYREWYSMIEGVEQAVPCIRLEPEISEIIEVLAEDWIIERGFGLIVSQKNISHHSKLTPLLQTIGHNNYFVVLDAGWSSDPLLQAVWATEMASSVYRVDENAVVFVSSSSFPADFGSFGLSGRTEIREYDLYNEVRRQIGQRFNQARIIYADWATTRPPHGAGGGGWIPRIDQPVGESIRIFRDRVGEKETPDEACQRIAGLVVAQSDWPSPPPTWGHYTIDLTASQSKFGVYHARMNTATRVNMHIHNALSQGREAPPSVEEPFEG